MKNTMKLFAIFVLLAVAAFGQVTLSTTTLGAAITSTSATKITLASTSTMLSQTAGNQINTVLYVDRELINVITVDSATQVTVRRAVATGEGGRPTTHASGAKVYFSITTNGVPAPSFFGGGTNITGEISGSCTAANLMMLPLIYPVSGHILDCKRTGAAGTSGQWVLVGNGSMAPAGQTLSLFCTGTTGSNENAFMNGAACSGATTSTYRYLITTPGTLANLQVWGSANVVGGGSDPITVYLNGSATAITCTIAAAAATCSDTTHSVAVVPGDRISVLVDSTASDTFANPTASIGLF